MGKVKTRFLGMDDIEKKQKQEQKRKAGEKQFKKKVKAPGKHKGGEKTVTIGVDEASLQKMHKAEELIHGEPASAKATASKEKKTKKTKARIRGKKYQKALKAVSEDKNKQYSLQEAIKILKKIKYAKFDESVELHINVEKEGLKGEVELSHSTGKTTRVKIVDDTVLDEIEKGKIDFDVLITHPSHMPRLAKLAKILGPKGLMPNPKTGTISDKPEEVAKKYSKGLLRWKTEPKAPLIHLMVGKISLEDKDLLENIKVMLKAIGKSNFQGVFIKTTMSPSLKLDLEKI